MFYTHQHYKHTKEKLNGKFNFRYYTFSELILTIKFYIVILICQWILNLIPLVTLFNTITYSRYSELTTDIGHSQKYSTLTHKLITPFVKLLIKLENLGINPSGYCMLSRCSTI